MARRVRKYWEHIGDARATDYRKYATAAGQASLQWNLLHEAMGHIFLTVMGGGYIGQFAAVWGSLPSDRAKRSALIAALEARQRSTVDPSPRQAEKVRAIKHLCGQAEALEIQRNNAVHVPLANVHHETSGAYETVLPDTLLRNPRALALEGKNILKEFRHCRDYARILGQFAMDLDNAMSRGRPLPDRPKPPRRGEKKSGKRSRQQSHAESARPPRSSQE